MQPMIVAAIEILVGCILVTALVVGLIVFSPAKRRRRRRKRHSSRPRIDLSRPAEPETDA